MTLADFFTANPDVALAFSGGTDSSYLLYAAVAHARRVKAYFIKTAFQPDFELADARRLAAFTGAALEVIETDILARPEVAANPADRCYHCKKALFSLLAAHAEADGFSVLLDGTNASDDEGDRPGMRALRELDVRSPLRECGLTKEDVRRLSRDAELFTWNKPAYACLATRIPGGRPITAALLAKAAQGEQLLAGLGFTDFRLRICGEGARLELTTAQMDAALAKRAAIVGALKPYFKTVALDLTDRAASR